MVIVSLSWFNDEPLIGEWYAINFRRNQNSKVLNLKSNLNEKNDKLLKKNYEKINSDGVADGLDPLLELLDRLLRAVADLAFEGALGLVFQDLDAHPEVEESGLKWARSNKWNNRLQRLHSSNNGSGFISHLVLKSRVHLAKGTED